MLTINIIIIVIGLVLIIQDLKYVLKQERLPKIIVEILMCMVSGVILNILFGFII